MGKNSDLITETIELELSIDADNINAELIDQPLLYRKYSRLEAESAAQVRAIELALNRAEARAHLKFTKTGAKLKVRDLESLVATDETVQKLEDELQEALELHSNMKGVLVAFRQRHEALKDLSANLRKEIVG